MKRGQTQFPENSIVAARRALSALPEKISYIERDVAFQKIEEDIKKALEKGYTLKEISETLSSQGVNMPVYFLKKHLLRNKKKQSSKCSEKQDATLQVKITQSEQASHIDGDEQ